MTAAFVPLIYVLAFIAVVVLVQTLAGVVLESGDKTRRVNRRLTMLDAGMDHEQVHAALVRRSAAPQLASRRLAALYERAEAYCRQAGLTVTPARLAAIAGGAAAAIWLAGLVLVSVNGGDLLLNGAVSLVGACALSLLGVFLWVRRARNARLKKFEEQLPLALDIMTRAIRAGHPVLASVQLAADELGDPIGSEFGLIVDETNYGAEFKAALTSFARRTGSGDAHFMAVAINIQAETGGNLAEILEGLTRVMRGRGTLAKRVKALASEGKASAYLLSALPVGLVAFQAVFNPKFYTDKFSDPIFWPTVACVGGLYLLGWAMIQRIINFKY
ncbi:type II secretion system F family protein [Phenylobacterium sp.]|jgi:tight adherence protein B|uniref:type II secretion system F family protein n=1 Tax=Phenylobacterium sp. TaxID=1871053 RepID=UPI002F4148AE